VQIRWCHVGNYCKQYVNLWPPLCVNGRFCYIKLVEHVELPNSVTTGGGRGRLISRAVLFTFETQKSTGSQRLVHTCIHCLVLPVTQVPGWPLIGNLLDLAPSKGNLVPTFAAWTKTYGPIVQFSIFSDKQVILSDEADVHELFVKRGTIYSGRSAPHAFQVVTSDISPAMMPKNGTVPFDTIQCIALYLCT
jgi:hypothetical protein